MNKWTTLLLTLVVLCVSWMPARAADAPTVLGIVEIRGLDSLSASAAELGQAAGQPLPKEMISMLLYGMLGTMPSMGIQPEGTLRAVLFKGAGPEPAMAILLPVENEGADYLSGLGAAGWVNQAETAEGILHYIGPDGSELIWKEIYFLKRGNTLVAGRDASSVRMADAVLSSLPPILPVEGDLAIQVRPSIALQAYETELQDGLDKTFKDPKTPPEAAAMGQLYVKGYLALAKQIDELVFGLGVADGNLNIHQRISPVADTTLARWLGSIGTPSAAASVVNLPDALLAEVAHMGDMNLIMPAYFRYMEEIMELLYKQTDDDGTVEEFMGTYMENAKKYWEQLDGDIGFSLLPPTKEYPLRLVEYVGLKDSSGLRELTRQIVEDANKMMQMGLAADTPPPMGIDVSLGEPREYRDIPIDTLTYELKPGVQIESAWPKGLPTKLTADLAWTPKGLLLSIGDTAQTEGLLDHVLDGTAVPITQRSSWKAAYPTPEPNLLDVSHIAIFDTIRSYMELVASYTDDGAGAAEMIPESPGNIESASYMAIGGMMTRLRFSLADIAAIAEKVQEIQQAQVAAQAAFMEEMQKEMNAMNSEEFQPMDGEEDKEWTAGDDDIEAVPAPLAPTPAPAR